MRHPRMSSVLNPAGIGLRRWTGPPSDQARRPRAPSRACPAVARLTPVRPRRCVISAAGSGSRTSPTGSGCPRSRCSASRGRSSARCARTRRSRRSWPRAPATTDGRWRTSPRNAVFARACSCRPARSPRGARRSRGRAPTWSSSTGPTRTRSALAAEEGAQPGRDRARRRRRLRPRALGHRRLRHVVRRTGPGVRHDLRPGRRRLARRGRGALRGVDGHGGDRGRAGRGRVPHGLARRGRAHRRRHARDRDGRAGLRGGLRGGVADPAARHPRHRDRLGRADGRRHARARRASGSRSVTPAPPPSPACTRSTASCGRPSSSTACCSIATEGPTDPEGYRAVIG